MDFAITISDQEMRRVQKDLANYSSTVSKEIQGAITRATYRVGKRTRLNLRWTSKLKQTVSEKIGKFKGEIAVNANYAGAVEFGTKPHIIRPKTKPFLAWQPGAGHRFWGVAGLKWVYATFVKHPGTRAQPYLGPAMEAEVRPFTKVIKKIIEDSTKRNSR